MYLNYPWNLIFTGFYYTRFAKSSVIESITLCVTLAYQLASYYKLSHKYTKHYIVKGELSLFNKPFAEFQVSEHILHAWIVNPVNRLVKNPKHTTAITSPPMHVI